MSGHTRPAPITQDNIFSGDRTRRILRPNSLLLTLTPELSALPLRSRFLEARAALEVVMGTMAQIAELHPLRAQGYAPGHVSADLRTSTIQVGHRFRRRWTDWT